MATDIGALHARMSAGYAEFRKDMHKAREALSTNAAKMRRAMEGVGKAFKSTLGHLKRFSGFAVAGGAVALTALIKKSVDTITEMGKFAQAVGVSVESLSTLQHVATLTGVELEDLADGLKTLAENAVDFAIGTGPAVEAFGSLKIKVKDANGELKDTETLFLEVVEELSKLEDGMLKAAFASQIFGDEAGQRMIRMMNLGTAGIEQLRQEARDLGLEMNTNMVQSAVRFQTQLSTLTAAASGLGINIATRLMPYLNQMVAAINEVVLKGGGFSAILGAIDEPFQLARAQKSLEQYQQTLIDIDKGGLAFKVLNPMVRREAVVEMIKHYSEEVGRLKALRDLREAEAKQRVKDAEDRAKADAKAQAAATKAATERLLNLQREADAKAEAEAKAKAEATRLKREAEERERRGVDTILQMEREVELADVVSRAGRVRWEIEKGILKDLNVEHQKRILQLAIEQDLLDTLAGEATEFEDLGDTVEYVFSDQMERAVDHWAASSTDALTDFVMTGKASFRDFANSVIRDLIRMQIQQNLTGPLFETLRERFGTPTPVKKQATGGMVSAGRMYEVNERGPELLSMGNRQYLMMANRSGHVSPLDEGAAGKAVAPSVRIVNVMDPSVFEDWANSPEGERVIVNTMGRNSTQFKQLLS